MLASTFFSEIKLHNFTVYNYTDNEISAMSDTLNRAKVSYVILKF